MRTATTDLQGSNQAPGDGRGEDVSVVIVSWNVCHLLRDCINSILSSRGNLSIRIIVVDNGSKDGSVDMVRAEFPHVHLIASQSNLGFARANNVGLAQARGQYIFFLNPDTIVKGEALHNMVSFLNGRHEFAMVGPRLIYPGGTVQRTCARVIPSLSLILWEGLYLHRLPIVGQRFLNRLISPYDLEKSQEVEAISGAAMLLRRAVADALGGFDESFLHTGEDIDLCVRLRQSGRQIFYCAEAQVVHLSGQSSLQALSGATTMSFLSMATYFERSYGRAYALTYRLIVQVIQMPLLLAVGVIKALARREGAYDLQERVRIAKAIWRWRVSE